MKAFVWDQSFVTDLPLVDEQHHGLVDLFNELSNSLFLADDSREAVLHATFERLVAYAQKHFREEEELMQAEGLDPRHIETHHKGHEDFVEQVLLMWSMREQMKDPSETFVGFLTSWLGMHILGIDQSMARQMRLIRQGVPADQAYARESTAHDTATQALLKMIGQLYHVLTLQNSELMQANRQLESRVLERTQALTRANEELQNANRQLEIFSRTDGLLQIANRQYFDEHLQAACARSFRSEQPMGLLMIDVDDFKRYNDRLGHQAGDACLQALARAISHVMQRTTDVVARYGGEELAVILPDTDEAGTIEVAQRVVAAVAALAIPHPTSTTAPHVTVSVGCVSRIAESHDASQALLADADAALYRAKAAGRNRWVMHVPQAA
jgi:hemerythrin